MSNHSRLVVRASVFASLAGAVALLSTLALGGCGTSPGDVSARPSRDARVAPPAGDPAAATPEPGSGETATLSAIRLRITGMMASKGGAIWMAWPDGVRDALDALPSIERIAWDEKFEVVSFLYDAAQVDRAAIDAAVKELGYGTEEAGEPTVKTAPVAAALAIPEAVKPLFAQAAKEGKLVTLKFTATWCAPCKAMTKTTIHDPDVAKELEAHFVFREIDTDELPEVSKAYGINGIPDTRIFRPDGTPVDQVRGFEGPTEFLARLLKAQKQ